MSSWARLTSASGIRAAIRQNVPQLKPDKVKRDAAAFAHHGTIETIRHQYATSPKNTERPLKAVPTYRIKSYVNPVACQIAHVLDQILAFVVNRCCVNYGDSILIVVLVIYTVPGIPLTV